MPGADVLSQPQMLGGKQTSIQEHLGLVVERVVAERPKDALAVVEVLSRLVKEAVEEGRPAGPKPVPPATEEELKAQAASAEQVLKLDKDFLEIDGDGVPQGPKQCCAIADFMVESDVLAWAGCGLGEQESYKVMCAMRNLSTRETEGIKSMRFWGKILGTEQDYYVVEAERDAQPDYEPETEGEEPPPAQALMYSWYAYYVCTDLVGNWTKLPELRPREILAAREIKKLFTGRLDAPVITHPYFEGTEANLLRAQIAQITADTVLCVKGFYLPPEEEGPVHLKPGGESVNPDFVWPAVAELMNPSAWMHTEPHIHRSGLTQNEPPAEDAPDKEDVEAYEKYLRAKAEQESDPNRQTMRGIEGDDLQWSVKRAGDTTLYTSPLPGTAERPKGPRCNATTYVRSVTWPGAVCATRGEQLVNMYVGYGWPAGKPDFYIRAPLDIQDEPDDCDEQPEPVEAPAPVPEEAA
eukprot:TRINITY_DN47596_c0_g1_i1.p1 TRINITY_DN47596_c0_g1~~TRINITY_DN47596_c0_g1_i1.p1  ORF type:complete len:467 (-),score=114.31 TRINITY_DN47596_c0_g1_i1:72-1472(-)